MAMIAYLSPKEVLRRKRLGTSRWRLRNKDRIREYSKIYRKKNLAARKKASREWYYKNLKHARKLHRIWLKKNGKKIKEARRKERNKNLEAARAYERACYYANKEKCLTRSREWKIKNYQKVRAHNHKQQALRMGAKGIFTEKDIYRLRKKYKGKCAYHEYCNGNLKKKGNEVIEHKTPLSRGGTNWPKNLQLTCRRCNSSKRSKTAKEFYHYLRKQHQR